MSQAIFWPCSFYMRCNLFKLKSIRTYRSYTVSHRHSPVKYSGEDNEPRRPYLTTKLRKWWWKSCKAKIRRPPTTYFISAHHVKTSWRRGQQSSTEAAPLSPCSTVVTRKRYTQARAYTSARFAPDCLYWISLCCYRCLCVRAINFYQCWLIKVTSRGLIKHRTSCKGAFRLLSNSQCLH